MKKYFLDTDNNGRHYIIPVDKRKEWREWKAGPGRDGENGLDEFLEMLKFAEMVGGCLSSVEFENPINWSR